MARLFRIVLVMLLVVGSTPAIYAQESRTVKKTAKAPFNPENPAEPDNGYVEPIVYYKVTISSNPTSVAYVSSGGEFTSGTSKYVYTSSRNSKYVFSHWTLNGEFYSERTSFYYTVETGDANFVAHYNFVPSSPTEPDPAPEIKVSPLYLTSNVEGACRFNQASGNEYEEDTWVELEAYVAKGYKFEGWYSGTTLISSNTRFNYLMPGNVVTLTAKVTKTVFNPSNPSEPNSSQISIKDVTSLIVNPSFDGGKYGCDNGTGNGNLYSPEGWQVTYTKADWGWKNFQPVKDGKGQDGAQYFEFWGATYHALDMSQEVYLPAGTYVLTAAMRTALADQVTNQHIYMKVGDEEFVSPVLGAPIGDYWNAVNAWQTLTVTLNLNADGWVTIGAKSTGGANSAGWFQIDNFRLMHLEIEEEKLLGDVNKDGVVNVFDIIAVVNYSLGDSDENLSLYDLNGDGAVNVFDIIKVVNISLE